MPAEDHKLGPHPTRHGEESSFEETVFLEAVPFCITVCAPPMMILERNMKVGPAVEVFGAMMIVSNQAEAVVQKACRCQVDLLFV